MNTFTEENYLKTIYHCSLDNESVSTNQLAAATNTKAASVTDMLKKLAEKQLINYTKWSNMKACMYIRNIWLVVSHVNWAARVSSQLLLEPDRLTDTTIAPSLTSLYMSFK